MADFSTTKVNGIIMHDVQVLIPRPSILFSNIFVSVRYPLDPKTGLFLWKNEDSVEVHFSKRDFNAISYGRKGQKNRRWGEAQARKEISYPTQPFVCWLPHAYK
ncbi:hypothetical protein [Hymenobacter terrenus]|uniref:hypothetical protein n=1 Tax=Hymenobacter terrenus TaxID=1629124 RepID=UPI000619CCAB|nr:hypothetical protein [Hymenobacter terrenus]